MFTKKFLKKTAACVVSLALLLSAVPALPSSASAAAGSTAQTDGRLTNGFITSDTLRIENGVIYGVEEYTAVDALLMMFNVSDLDLRVLDENGRELGGREDVYEGCSVQYVVEGQVLEQLTVGSLEEYVQPVYTTSVPDGSDASEDVTITSSKPVYFDVSYIGYVDDFDGWYDHEGTELILSMDASYTVKVYPSMYSSQLLFTYQVNIRKPSEPPVLTPSVPDWGNSHEDVIITADREVTFQVAYTNFDDDTFETYEVTGKTLTLNRNGDYYVKVLGDNGWKWEYNVYIQKELAAANSGGLITSDTLRIENGVIYGVEEYTAVDQLLRMFNVPDLDLRVLGKNGNELDRGDLVAEGDCVQYVVDGEILEQLTVGSLEEYVQPVYTTSVPNGGVTSENVTITSDKEVWFIVEYLGYVDDFDGEYDVIGTEVTLSFDASYRVRAIAADNSEWIYTVSIRKTPLITASVPDWGNSHEDVIITADREVTFQVTYTSFDDDTVETYEVTGKTLTLDRNGDYYVKVLGDNGWKWEYNVFINKELAAANPGGLITSDTLRIEDGVIYDVEDYTTVNWLLCYLLNPVSEGMLRVVDENGSELKGSVEKVQAGYKVQCIINGEVAEQLTIGTLKKYEMPVITTSVPDGEYTNQNVTIESDRDVWFVVDYLGHVDDFDGDYDVIGTSITLSMDASYTVKAYTVDGGPKDPVWNYWVSIRKEPIVLGGIREGSVVSSDATLHADRYVQFTVNGVETEGYGPSMLFTEDGSYEVQAADRHGNTASISFVMDKKPTYTSTVPSGQPTNGDVTITTNKPVNFMVNDEIVATGTEYTITSDGITDVRMYTLLGTYGGTYRANINKQPLVLTGAPENGITRANVAIRSNFRAIYTVNGVSDGNYKNGVNFTEPGTYTVTAADERGNEATVSFTIDRTKPTFTASVPSGRLTGEDITLTADKVVNFVVNDETIATGTSCTISQSGLTVVYIYDLAGNYGGAYKANIDKTPPVLTAVYEGTNTAIENGATVDRSVTIKTSKTAQFIVNDGAPSDRANFIKFKDPGTYTVKAVDALGNVSEVFVITIEK